VADITLYTEAERVWFEHWAEHPGSAWVREIYGAHRHA
jgi:hypothetical protein